jgi:hypothetical protein
MKPRAVLPKAPPSAKSWTAPVLLPEGGKRIAQRFNAGIGVPTRRPKSHGDDRGVHSPSASIVTVGSFVPHGTFPRYARAIPAFKRWAMFFRPAGLSQRHPFASQTRIFLLPRDHPPP